MIDKYRVVTFQSKEVVDILRSRGEYYACRDKAREGSFDDRDIQNCSGNIPIWVFQHPAFALDTIGIKQFCNMLQTFTEEMSIDTLNDLYMIELYLDSKPVKGVAHNDNSIACVIPSIKLEDVICIYKVSCNSEDVYNFYDLIPLQVNSRYVPLFPDGFRSNLELYKRDKYPILNLSRFKSADEYYVRHMVIYAYLYCTTGDINFTFSVMLDILARSLVDSMTLEQVYNILQLGGN